MLILCLNLTKGWVCKILWAHQSGYIHFYTLLSVTIKNCVNFNACMTQTSVNIHVVYVLENTWCRVHSMHKHHQVSLTKQVYGQALVSNVGACL